MSTIDKRIVEMDFENKDFEKGIKDSEKSLKDFDKALRDAGSGGTTLSTLGGIASGIADKFTGLGAIATGALMRIGEMAIETGIQLVKSLSLDQIVDGFIEYELKMNAIRVMMASGKTAEGLDVTLEQVNDHLEQLNIYADRTIYSFKDMTQTIGQFTNAGVNVELAVEAIMGITNQAALAGASTQEAASSMNAFATSLAFGHVALRQWRSIEINKMGTVEFKQQLIDTAVAMGTLEKRSDGLYNVLTAGATKAKMGNVISATKEFSYSLHNQWLTADVLTETLKRYNDESTEIGKKAREAAETIRTFTMLKDNITEAIASGWGVTFERLIGDFNQSSALFTNVADTLEKMVLKSNDARNDLLQEWSDLGGRRDIISGFAAGWQSLLLILGEVRTAFQKVFPPTTAEGLAKISESFRKLMSSFKIKTILNLEKFGKIFVGVFRGIAHLGKNVANIFKAVGQAFRNVFPPVSVDTLVNIAKGFNNFMREIKLSSKSLNYLKTIFEGLFSIVSLAGKFIFSVFKGLYDGLRSVLDLIPAGKNGGILGFFATLATFFIGLKDAAEKGEVFTKISKAIADGILWFVEKIGEAYNTIKNSKIGEFFSEMFQSIKDAVSSFADNVNLDGTLSFFDKIKTFFENFSFLNSLLAIFEPIAGILKPIGLFLIDLIVKIKDAIAGQWETKGLGGFIDIIGVLLQGGILLAIKQFVSTLTRLANSADGITSGLTGIFGGLGGILQSYQNNLNAKQLMTIATAIAILAVSVLVLSFINPSKLEGATTALAMLFIQLGASFAVLQKTMGNKGLATMALQLMGLSAAILLLSFALSTIASIPEDRLKGSLIALGAILLELVIFSKLMSNSKGFMAAAAGLIALGIAINIIVIAVKSLGQMDPAQLSQGLIAIGLIALGMAIFATTVSQFSKGGNLIAAAVAIGILAVALLQIAGIVALIGIINPEVLAQGLNGLGIILLQIAAFSIIISQAINPANLLLAAASMVLMGAAILAISGAIMALGNMGPDALMQGVIGLAAALLVMTVSLLLLSNPTVLIGALAMLIISAAILVLTPALIALSNVSMEGIGKALLFLVGVFAVVGIAGALLTPVIPSILGLAIAIALLGIGVFAIGAGLMLFATGLALLSAGGVAAVSLLIFAIKEVINLVPFILTKLGEAIVALATVIAEGAPAIAGAVIAIFSALITLLTGELPRLIEVVLMFIVDLVEVLVEQVPLFVDAAMRLIVGFLQGISNNVGAVIEAIFDLVINILNALAEKLPELIEAGVNVVLAYVEGITTQIPLVVDTAFQLVIDFINGLADSIRTNTPLILEATANLATAFIDGVKTYLNIGEGESIAGSIITGLINGITSGVSSVVNAAIEMGKSMLTGITEALGMKSPSKEFAKIGMDSNRGLVLGLTKSSSLVVDATKKVGESSLDAFRSTMSNISDLIDSDIDSSPVITPILNLDNLRSGSDTIRGLLSTDQTYNLATLKSRHDREILRDNQNGSNSLQEVPTSIHNEFNLNGITIRSEADIDKLAQELFNKQENALRSRGIRPSYTH